MSGINLLPDKIKETKKIASRNLKFYSILISILFFLILGIIVLEAANQILVYTSKGDREQIQTIEQEISKNQKIEDNATKLNEIITNLEELEKDQPLWSAVLTNLALSTPVNMRITNLAGSVKDSPNFKISGAAATFEDIIKFKDKLESSPYFKDVVFISSEKSDKDGKTEFSYSLTFNFEKKR